MEQNPWSRSKNPFHHLICCIFLFVHHSYYIFANFKNHLRTPKIRLCCPLYVGPVTDKKLTQLIPSLQHCSWYCYPFLYVLLLIVLYLRREINFGTIWSLFPSTCLWNRLITKLDRISLIVSLSGEEVCLCVICLLLFFSRSRAWIRSYWKADWKIRFHLVIWDRQYTREVWETSSEPILPNL